MYGDFKMDTKKVVVLLLVVAIVFSVLTVLNIAGVFTGNDWSSSSGAGYSDSGAGVSFTVEPNGVPNLILGVLNG